MNRDVAFDDSRPTRGGLLLALIVFVVLVISRVPLARTALHGSELTTDEPELTQMALDRFFGLPLSNTHWPSLTNQILLVPTIAADFVASGRPRSAEGFAQYAGNAYRDSRHLILVHRMVVVVLCAGATAWLAWVLRRRSGGVWLAIVAVLLLQNERLVTYSTLGLGHGPALAAMIGILALSHLSIPRSCRDWLIGLLLGIAIASRNTSILLLPVVVGLTWDPALSPRGFVRALGRVALGVLIGSAPAWVNAVLEPVRWAKANLGNFAKVGTPTGIAGSLQVVLEATGWWFWLAALIAAIALFVMRQRRVVVVAWLASFVLAGVISARAPLVETRYFDAIIVGAVLVMIAALDAALRSLDLRRIRGMQKVVLVAAMVAAAWGWWTAQREFAGSLNGLRPVEKAMAGSLRSTGDILVIDRSLLPFVKPRLTSDCLRGLAERTEETVDSGEGLREFTARYRLSPAVADAFTLALTEKEQAEATRCRVMAASPPIGEGLDVIVSGDARTIGRFGGTKLEDVPALLRDGKASQAVLLTSAASVFTSGEFDVAAEPDGMYIRVRRR